MSLKIFHFITIFVFLFQEVHSAKILGLFPHTGKSHFMVFEPLLRKLVERGHNVTVASFFPSKNAPSNFKDISLQGLAELRLESYDLSALESENILYRIPRLGRFVKQLLQLTHYQPGAFSICEKLVDHKPFLDSLNENYDIVLFEVFFSDCMLGILHVYGVKAPVVGLISGSSMTWAAERVGLEDNPAYVPVVTTPFTAQMSFMDRVENTILNIIHKVWYYYKIQGKENVVLRKKYGEVPDLREISKNTSVILVNGYHTLSGVKPLLPSVVEVGGMHLSSDRKTIPQFIEKFLNESTHGVVLFSLGSHIKTKSMPKYKQQIFINSLSKLKQRVIWKFEDSDAEGTLIGNILMVKWLPQYDLLLHEKVIAFISHGGMLGMTEAMSAGKPMVVVPFFADQPTNAAAAAEAGVGVVLSYEDLTEELVDVALERVLSDKMRAHAAAMSRAWHDRDTPPLELAVSRTERVLRHPAPPCAARDLPAYQHMLLDVAIAILTAIAIVMALLVYCILKLVKIFKNSSSFIDKQKMH